MCVFGIILLPHKMDFFGQISSLPGTKHCVNISLYNAHLVVFVEERIVRHASVCEVEL